MSSRCSIASTASIRRCSSSVSSGRSAQSFSAEHDWPCWRSSRQRSSSSLSVSLIDPTSLTGPRSLEELVKGQERCVPTTLDGADRHAQQLGRLLLGQPLVENESHHLAFLLRQGVDVLVQFRPLGQ